MGSCDCGNNEGKKKTSGFGDASIVQLHLISQQDCSKVGIILSICTMGRGRGKAKKSSIIAHREDGSGEEEKLPVKRRGRPTKAHKEEEEEAEKTDENKDTKLEAPLENGKKRKKAAEENPETVKDENGIEPKTNGHELTKAVGFRHNGSRRKNKPRRAAEVGVSACEVCSWLVLRS
ncbi:hypothetical protein L6452_42511 [Arctium lappa]|uniref:Uncharacterized protein n=1 Tax=Arctium lappa TaxID=4217 RepID=A0ACB8XHU8_ARCLA|nr:hypothetical protein L6452_42511 [Arctium lappa]